MVGVADERHGDWVVACAIAQGITPEDLDAHCRQSSLADYKRPLGYLLVAELPHNSIGKPARKELRTLATDAHHVNRLHYIAELV